MENLPPVIFSGDVAPCGDLANETTTLINSPSESESKVVLSLHDVTVLKPLKRRWYILGIFSALAFIQGAVWNTWGPIAASAFKVFPQWDNSTIALLANWGSVTFLLFFLPMTWFQNVKGLRCAVLFTGFLMAFGTGIRCITFKGFLSTNFIHIGQFLNGIAGIIVNTAPLLVSADWFPLSERTTATAFTTVMTTFGVAFAFILGPMVVGDVKNSKSFKGKSNEKLEQNIFLLMQIEFFTTVAILLCACIYFPSKPFRPPSISASVRRYNFKDSVLAIIKHKNLLLLTSAYALSSAVTYSWFSVMDLTLEFLHIPQMKAGWVGFTMEIGGCILAVILGRFSDLVRRRIKCIILSGLILNILLAIIFGLIIFNVLKINNAFIYVVVISMGCINISLSPLFFELASEIAYPINENITGTLLSGSCNVISVFFYMLFFIPNIGILWMNWCLIFSVLISIPLMLGINELYQRSSIDDQHTIQ